MMFFTYREHKSSPIIIRNSSLGPLVQTDVADTLSKPSHRYISTLALLGYASNVMLSVSKISAA